MNWLRAIALFAVALALRVPGLDDRPMHADEAVQAARLDNPEYDPRDHHGPVLAYLTWLSGVKSFESATETRLRLIPAVAGSVLAALPGPAPLLTGALAACSPAMRWYSRDYIPEMLLLLWTALMLLAAARYAEDGGAAWAAVTGALWGLMFATKETALIAIVCMLVASGRRALATPLRHWAMGAGCGVAVVVLLLGPLGFVRSIAGLAAVWAPRSVSSVHVHPPLFYAGLLVRTELPVLALAMMAAASRRPSFLGRWTALVFVVYSLIPYKTPWCALTPLLGFVLLAGEGAGGLSRRLKPWIAGLACAVLVAQAADRTWSYAETTRDVLRLRPALEQFERGTAVQVISRQNLWPLPWYLREFRLVRWWNAVPVDTPLAPIIIATPDMEAQLLRAMYELPPPGERPLYRPLVEGVVRLRGDVEIHAVARASEP